MPELRADRLTDTWVIVAEGRLGRPHDFGLKVERKAKQGTCPFCPGQEAMTPPETFAIRGEEGEENGPGWKVRVVPNKFPALGPTGNPVEQGHLLRSITGVGTHEVIIEAPEHDEPFHARAPGQWALLARALQQRLRALRADPRVGYALGFKNQGPASGASLIHPHSQVVAMPVVPERVRRELEAFDEHHRLTQGCLLEDIVAEERDAKVRILEERDDLALYTPYAARFPYEMMLVPRRHEARFEDATGEEVDAFGRALGRALVRLEGVLAGSPVESYHFALHTAPARGRPDRFHWHCEVMPSASFFAGFEKGTGMFLNHLGPEASAEKLRAVQAGPSSRGPRKG